MEIKRLDWDSDFFGIETGEISDNCSLAEANKYQLLVSKQNKDTLLEIEGFDISFQETKVIFSKRLQTRNLLPDDTIFFDVEADFSDINNDEIYSLAYESGKHSRFKLDSQFSDEKFKLLYNKWIDNSINKKFADKIFCIKDVNQMVGFVTVKNNKPFFATIGLIAVSENQQGKGIGSELLKKAENYCLSQDISELRIPTQKGNIIACNFYRKMNYTVVEETIIKHYWRK